MIVAVGAELDLPEPVRFGRVSLGRPPRRARVQFPPDPVLPDLQRWHVVSLQQVTRIYTSTFYWLVVDATDEDQALRIVDREIDPVISVGLALVLGHDVPTQVLRVAKLGSSEPLPSAWGAGARVTPLDERGPDRTELARLLRAIEKNRVVAGCLPYLARATKYLAVTPTAGDLAMDAALLEFAKALEYVVLKVPATTSSETVDDNTVPRILADLKRKLEGERPTHIQAAAVQRAATSLRRSVSRTVKDSIRRFASLHRMDAGWTAAAMRLINVRNKHLAHPGEPLSNADRDSLTKRSHGARETVLDAIRAVLNSDEAQGIPPAPVTEAAPRGDLTIRWKPGPMASWSPAPQPEQGGVDRCHDRPVKGAVLPRERDCDIGESFRRERRDPPP